LKLARGEEKQRPIAEMSEVQEWPARQPRQADKRGSKKNDRGRNGRERNGHDRAGTSSHEKGMVRLALNTGKADGIRVNHIVGTLAHFADIPGYALGKIHIQEQQTLVDVPEQYARQVLAKTGIFRIGKQAITVERA